MTKEVNLCDDCGEPLKWKSVGGGMQKPHCPNCHKNRQEKTVEKPTHTCRGCWKEKTDCVAHHVSYEPEKVVPMCSRCHALLHERTDHLPHLTPDMSRRKAERLDLVSIVGLDDHFETI